MGEDYDRWKRERIRELRMLIPYEEARLARATDFDERQRILGYLVGMQRDLYDLTRERERIAPTVSVVGS